DPLSLHDALPILDGDLVSGQYPDEIHPQLAGYMGEDDVPSAYIHLEHRVGQGLDDRALELDHIVFCQVFLPPFRLGQISSAIVRISGSPSVMRMVFS